jgi:hypothetical protein
MSHDECALLEALAQFHRRDRYSHTPPGDRQGTGAYARTLPAPYSALTLPADRTFAATVAKTFRLLTADIR